MPNQPRKASGISRISQTKPAFWIQVSEPAGILPTRVPDVLCKVMGSPVSAPKTPKVMTSGTSTCMVVTPAFPSPAFKPSARPCMRLGKKKLMLDMDEAKLPPPKPDKSASNWKVQSGVFLSCRAKPAPTAGIIKSAVVKNMVFRPPAIRMKKVLGIRSVAPQNPAIAVSVNSSDLAKGKPRLSICTVMMPQ